LLVGWNGVQDWNTDTFQVLDLTFEGGSGLNAVLLLVFILLGEFE
jgi:hypothetical protein